MASVTSPPNSAGADDTARVRTVCAPARTTQPVRCDAASLTELPDRLIP
jgi:hypothetical protein